MSRTAPLSIAMIGTRGLPAVDGGVEAAVEALSRELAERGHRITVYGRRAHCDPGLRRHRGVGQVVLPQIDTKHLEAISHTALATGHAVARGGYDLVHFHATGPALLSWLPRLRRLPTVATIQGLDWKREKWGPIASGVLRLAARAAATVPDETIVVSKSLRGTLREEYGRSAHYIPNGVDLSFLAETSPVGEIGDRPFALFLGRIVPEKQVHVLIDAFRRVPGDFHLAIAGSSSHSEPYVRSIEERAARDDRVVLLGSRHGAEKAWLLRHAAVFVQPSTIEGLPIALLEALACDRLTIVSDIAENLEAVSFRDGAPYGLVFRTGDVEDLARRLAQALDPAPSHLRETPPAADVRDSHNWKEIADRTELVYRKALGG